MTSESVWEFKSKAVAESKSSLDADLLPLFKRLSAGELDCLASVYDCCAKLIYGLALWRTGSAADAADVVQDVFVRLAMKSQLDTVRHPARYILKIAHNTAFDLLRKHRVEKVQNSELLLPISNEPDQLLNASRLNEYLLELPSEQREALYLRYYAGLSLREIAKVTGVSLFTVASRCRLGLKKLQKRFGETK